MNPIFHIIKGSSVLSLVETTRSRRRKISNKVGPYSSVDSIWLPNCLAPAPTAPTIFSLSLYLSLPLLISINSHQLCCVSMLIDTIEKHVKLILNACHTSYRKYCVHTHTHTHALGRTRIRH